jgi:hypothetical protein
LLGFPSPGAVPSQCLEPHLNFETSYINCRTECWLLKNKTTIKCNTLLLKFWVNKIALQSYRTIFRGPCNGLV